MNVRPVFKRVDTCAAEFATSTRLHVFDLRGGVRGGSDRSREDHDPRRRPEPHRPGHRVRLLLRARGVRAARRSASRPSWSTAIRRPSRPTTTPRIACTSSRSRSRTCSRSSHKEKPKGVIVQYGGQTPLKLVARARGGRRADHRHVAGLDRHRRGPRALPAAGQEARAQAAAESHRAHRGAGGRAGARSRLSAGRAAVATCSAAARWKSCFNEDDLRDYMTDAVERLERQPGAARPLPRRRDRGRRRRDLRRRGRARSAASWSTSSRPACTPATPAARCRRISLSAEIQDEAARADAQAGQGAEGHRAHEHPVRDPERRHLRARSESARLAHGAVRVEGDGRAAREDRRARHDRDEAQAAWACRSRSCRRTSR